MSTSWLIMDKEALVVVEVLHTIVALGEGAHLSSLFLAFHKLGGVSIIEVGQVLGRLWE